MSKGIFQLRRYCQKEYSSIKVYATKKEVENIAVTRKLLRTVYQLGLYVYLVYCILLKRSVKQII